MAMLVEALINESKDYRWQGTHVADCLCLF